MPRSADRGPSGDSASSVGRGFLLPLLFGGEEPAFGRTPIDLSLNQLFEPLAALGEASCLALDLRSAASDYIVAQTILLDGGLSL
jgi:hypothetical protein